MIDGIFYTLYWRRHNNGDADIALLAVLMGLAVMTFPYIGIFWVLEDLLPISIIDIIGTDITIFGSYGLIILLLAYHFLWHKRYRVIINQHEKYNNRKYRRLANLFIVLTILGAIILCGMCCLLNNLRA